MPNNENADDAAGNLAEAATLKQSATAQQGVLTRQYNALLGSAASLRARGLPGNDNLVDRIQQDLAKLEEAHERAESK